MASREIEVAIKRRTSNRGGREATVRREVMRDFSMGRVPLAPPVVPGVPGTPATPGAPPITVQPRSLTGQFGAPASAAGTPSSRPPAVAAPLTTPIRQSVFGRPPTGVAPSVPTAPAPAPTATVTKTITGTAPTAAAPAPVQGKTTEGAQATDGPPPPPKPSVPPPAGQEWQLKPIYGVSGRLDGYQWVLGPVGTKPEPIVTPYLPSEPGGYPTVQSGAIKTAEEEFLERTFAGYNQQLLRQRDAALTALNARAASMGALGGAGAGFSGDVLGLGAMIEAMTESEQLKLRSDIALVLQSQDFQREMREMDQEFQRWLQEQNDPGWFETLANVGITVAGFGLFGKDETKGPGDYPESSDLIGKTEAGGATAPIYGKIATSAQSGVVALPPPATMPATEPSSPVAAKVADVVQDVQQRFDPGAPTSSLTSYWNPMNRVATSKSLQPTAQEDAQTGRAIDGPDWRRLQALGLADLLFGTDGGRGWFLVDDPRVLAISGRGPISDWLDIRVVGEIDNSPTQGLRREVGASLKGLIDRGLADVRTRRGTPVDFGDPRMLESLARGAGVIQ